MFLSSITPQTNKITGKRGAVQSPGPSADSWGGRRNGTGSGEELLWSHQPLHPSVRLTVAWQCGGHHDKALVSSSGETRLFRFYSAFQMNSPKPKEDVNNLSLHLSTYKLQIALNAAEDECRSDLPSAKLSLTTPEPSLCSVGTSDRWTWPWVLSKCVPRTASEQKSASFPPVSSDNVLHSTPALFQSFAEAVAHRSLMQRTVIIWKFISLYNVVMLGSKNCHWITSK